MEHFGTIDRNHLCIGEIAILTIIEKTKKKIPEKLLLNNRPNKNIEDEITWIKKYFTISYLSKISAFRSRLEKMEVKAIAFNSNRNQIPNFDSLEKAVSEEKRRIT